MRANLPIAMDVHLRKSYQLPQTLPLGALPPDPRYTLALHVLTMGLS